MKKLKKLKKKLKKLKKLKSSRGSRVRIRGLGIPGRFRGVVPGQGLREGEGGWRVEGVEGGGERGRGGGKEFQFFPCEREGGGGGGQGLCPPAPPTRKA